MVKPLSESSKLKIKAKKENSEKQWLFFSLVLTDRKKISEISGDPLIGELNSTWFHHILPKSTHPKLRYCPENVVVLTTEEHHAVEMGKVFPEIEKRKMELLQEYDEHVKETKEYEEEYLNLFYNHIKNNTEFFKNKYHQ